MLLMSDQCKLADGHFYTNGPSSEPGNCSLEQEMGQSDICSAPVLTAASSAAVDDE